MTRPLHLVVGPGRHGVVQHATRVATAGGADVLAFARPRPVDVAGRDVIVHFTDKLFGPDAETAATTLLGMVAGARATVVLHDLPQESDGTAEPVRRAGYARVAQGATTLVVSSEHEKRLLADLPGAPTATVVPLPVDRWATDPVPHERTVATLGFVYPGKGLEEVIDAAAQVPGGVEVVNLGAPARGHERLVDELRLRAASAGVTWSTTGWLPTVELRVRLRTVGVPVAAHRHLSASASVNAWLEAGRRPLMLSSDYAAEVLARMPGSLRVVEPADLAAAIEQTLQPPDLTNLPAALELGPTSAQVCARLEAAR